MTTWNKSLHKLTKKDVNRISVEYLMGWQDFVANGYEFRLKSFNHMREKYGMEPLTKEMSFDYRVNYIKSHYTYDEIKNTITEYMKTARVGDTRWTGIELFDCRFGREYAKIFKQLLGAHEYRNLAETLRNMKSIEVQTKLYGGVGLAGEETKQKAIQTNLIKHGGPNVMDDSSVRDALAHTNQKLYGGISPFCDKKIRQKSMQKKNPDLVKAMAEYKKTRSIDVTCESLPEFIVFKHLVDKFGEHDVYSQYGIHPYDARYPYNCDFYIKSIDLFIELNLFYVHGHHWFDDNNHDDALRLKHLMESGSAKNKKAAEIWTELDIEKRQKAKESDIKYLVFWDDSYIGSEPVLADFKAWFFDYDCDYKKFIIDFPKNTY